MKREYDPDVIDPYQPPVTQPAWAAMRDLARAGVEAESFELDPDERYWESRDSGLTREQSIAAVQFAIETNKYTKDWIPPPDDDNEGKPS
jgi:hypothetical protein